MSEILSAIRLKDKLTIAGVMAAVAAVLAIFVGVFTICTADRHTHKYDFSLQMEEDGSFSLVGNCSVKNCEDPFYVEKNLQGVELSLAVRPTCVNEGSKIYSYDHNGVGLKYTEILPLSAHTYEYELVSNGENVHINGMCQVEGCKNPYVFIYDAKDLTLMEVEEATCFSPRKETYAFVSGGETKTFVTLVEENIPHTLLGVPATSFQNLDKTYPYGLEGVKPLGETAGCGAIGQGYYVCEFCRMAVGVNIRRPDHKFTYSESELSRPDLDKNGTAVVRCVNDDCTESIQIVLPKVEKGVNAVTKSPATELHREVLTYTYVSNEYNFTVTFDLEIGELLAHDYEYSLKPDENTPEQINLIGKCTQPDCQTPNLVVKNVETTFEDTSTCTKKGYWIWTHVLADGTIVQLKVQSISFASHNHMKFDADVDVISYPTETMEGSVKIRCNGQGCTDYIVVTIPKVVIGENATLITRFTNGILVDYLYVTDNGVEILIKELFCPKA